MRARIQNVATWHVLVAKLIAVIAMSAVAIPGGVNVAHAQLAQNVQNVDTQAAATIGDDHKVDHEDDAQTVANVDVDVVDPWRVMGLLSIGAPLRVTRRADLGQGTFAPLFFDANIILFLPTTSALRHGPLLGLSTNITRDGGFHDPIGMYTQWLPMIGYAGSYTWSQDMFALAHIGVPFDLGASGTVGVEVSASLGYRMLAGVGVFTALSSDVFGAEGGISMIASLELGMFIDYEVLP